MAIERRRWFAGAEGGERHGTGPGSRFDPKRPVAPSTGQGAARAAKSIVRQSQRQRRSLILAAIRRLLIEEGYKGVTVRRIAELSGYVVQTVYNLVGPRDLAIVEAIADYTLHVGRLAPVNPEDPAAMIKTIEWQVQSVRFAPEFTRQVCLIYFTEGRHIFYEYRARQVRNVQSILAKQKRIGVLRRDVDSRDLAQKLMIYSSAIFIEWADRPFPIEQLIPRLKSGYAHILAGAISPKFGGLAAMPL
jgi:AcrR family transcriptional regulator